ncbi:hypothetical protein HHK36_004015 [Tetracentron sinense]|uniref:Endonuclease/exonuclease/phosphatase domain-containing protein n=1 Tax=Tetracentron sinense TaxID=13715 RepID=A0A834ZPB1_TETSI|nr:hypothetical protein HHK36_004015 [Tetracentron sinense]
MEYNLRGILTPCDVPVVGYEMKANAFVLHKNYLTLPSLQLFKLDPRCKTFNCHVSRYRELLHPSEVATTQCISGVTLKMPVKESCHCSTKFCFETLNSHHAHHCQAVESVRKTSNVDDQELGMHTNCGSSSPADSGPAFGNGSLLDGLVMERECKSWVKVCSSNTYAPSRDDCGFRLRLESVAIDCTKELLAPLNIIMTDLVIAAPIYCCRCMTQIGPPKEFRNFHIVSRSSGAGTFSVLSYNVLSDIYANMGLHSYCPEWALTWEYRRQNLLREITGYKADILCLQEVNFFIPVLQIQINRCWNDWYGESLIVQIFCWGNYYKDYFNVSTDRGSKTDGCAICFRRDKFKEIMKYELEFENIVQSVVRGLRKCQNKDIGSRLMKDNVALIVVLEPKKRAFSDALHSRICVANTHIHSNKDLTDVKLWQVATLVNGLKDIVEQAYIPLVVCGDLNSLPGCAPHSLLANAKVETDHEEMTTDPLEVFPTLNLEPSLPLVRPRFYFLEDHKGISLKVEGLLELLDLESMRETFLPSPQWSLDHIALMATFSTAPYYPDPRLRDPPPVFPPQKEKKSKDEAPSPTTDKKSNGEAPSPTTEKILGFTL